MKRIEVVAALIIRNKTILATQRGYGDFKGGWEFPGGKIEPGENPDAAVKREIYEELNANVEVGNFIKTIEYDYPKFHLTMHCYVCTLASETVELKEHAAARWLSLSEIDSVDWLPADVAVLDDVKLLLQ